MADGVPAPHRPRPPVGDLRRRDAAAGSVSAHRRLRPRRARGVGRRRRTGRSSRSTPTSPASTRSSPRITAPGCRRSSRCSASSRSRGPADDVVVWVKMMAWDLSGNYSFELLRHDLVARGRRRTDGGADAAVSGRRPEHPAGSVSQTGRRVRRVRSAGAQAAVRAAPTRPAATARDRRASVARVRRRALSAGDPAVRDFLLGGARPKALGSNNWVVDGTLTASGKPLLANDPHLGTRLPSTWYLAHISAGDFDVIGAHASRHSGGRARPQPVHRLGRDQRRRRRRGSVSRAPRRRPARTRNSAARRNRSRIIPETIVVKGAAPVQLERARHAPRSAGLRRHQRQQRGRRRRRRSRRRSSRSRSAGRRSTPTTARSTAFLKVNEAHNWTEFTDALRGFVVPSQNFVYADVDGHIGYYAPGRIPMRASGDGSRPADGLDRRRRVDRLGAVRRAAAPFDPPEHFIVTANHRPAPADLSATTSASSGPEPYRAQRIIDLGCGAEAASTFTPDDFARIQADTVSLHAKTLLPLLLAHVAAAMTRRGTAVLDLLRQWNFDATGDSAAAAIFQAWFLQLAPALVGDELGPPVTRRVSGQVLVRRRASSPTRSTVERLAVVRRRARRRSTKRATTRSTTALAARASTICGGGWAAT